MSARRPRPWPSPPVAARTAAPRTGPRLALALALGVASACSGSPAADGDAGDETGSAWAHDPEACTAFSVPNRFGYRWKNLNHRVSIWSEELVLDADGCDGDTLAVGIVGGDWTQGAGVSDNAFIRYGWQRVAGDVGAQLGAARRSFEAELALDTEYTHEETVTLERADLGLREYDVVTAFVGGFGWDTGAPTQPPDYPAYDPTHGYVSRGLGVAAEIIDQTDTDVTLRWSIRYEPGMSTDRPDHDEAVPFARIGARVDVVFVGASGVGVHAGEVETMMEYPKQETGMEILLEHAPLEDQRIALAGEPGLGAGLWGLTRFDWRFDPAEFEGGGHYMREFDVNLQLESYDDQTGEASFLLDGFASNSSQIITTFALRSHFRGAMAWIQAEGVGEAQSVERERMPGSRQIALP